MIDAAVARAREAFPAWSGTSVRQRAAIARRFGDLVLANRDRILDAIQADTNKSRSNALDEILDVVGLCAYYAHHAGKFLRSRRRAGAVPILTKTIERHVPIGVVGVITPWNYPFTLPASDLIPAIVAGNTVVLLPDAVTPRSADVISDLLAQAGVPDGVVTVVHGGGRVHGTSLIDQADFIMFTGSTATGAIVAQQCAARLIGFSGELGGKNPLVVLDDADVQRAAKGSVRASFSNSGQLCVSTERAYVHTDVFDEFVSAFVAETEAMKLGAGNDWEIDMGPLISDTQADRVMAQIDDAVAKGATVLTGGRRRPDIAPTFIEPTILAGVTDAMILGRNETFGPVISVQRVSSNDEALQRANDSDYGLNTSVWSRRRGTDFANRVRSGTVTINDGFSASFASHDAPMGGMKRSGIGRRHGSQGILKYTDSQTVAQQRLLGIAPLPGQSNEQFATLMTRAIGWLAKLR
jgi:succinate-semialdehyde dehydrogenase/glutarate-semialdehyde dehydrogenase